MSKQAIQRILNKDMKEINNMELSKMGIYIEFNEENILEANAIIIGPKDTPYENGVLYFKILFPKNYPYSPPQVFYISRSKYRIHPNLYVGKVSDNFLGKVCLSIINTWSGPKWTTVMHIGSVMVSIQSLLTDNPIRNEPGFENEKGTKNDIYNLIVQHDTFYNLIYKNCNDIHTDFLCFKDIIQEHYNTNKQEIIETLKEYKGKYKENTCYLSFYNIKMNLTFGKLLTLF